MRHAILVVHTEPSAEHRTDEFNTWYDAVHIPEVIERVPGIVAARRYVASPSGPAHPDQRFLAIYDIQADDPERVLRELQGLVAAQELDRNDALSRTPPPTMTLYHVL